MYLTGAVSLTAPRREYAPTRRKLFPGVARRHRDETDSSHSRAFVRRVTSRQFRSPETVNPAVLRRSRRDVGSGIRIRNGIGSRRGAGVRS